MAGIDKAAIAFTIAIVATGVGMALYGESVQNAPAAPAQVISEPAVTPTEKSEPQEDPSAELAEKVKEDTMMKDEPAMEEKEPAMEEKEPAMEEKEPAMEGTEPPMEETEPAMEGTSEPQTVTVDIPVGTAVPGCEATNECYIPASVTVNVGDTVEWINVDTAAHTVTSGVPADGPSGVFDSSLIMVNASFAVTFEEPGSYDYFCMVHPWMVGDVQVN